MDTSVTHKDNVPAYSAAHYLLEGLTEIGIDYLFCNFGTDHAPIIEEMARHRKLGEAMPKVVRCPHENTAAHMAGGYALVTGRGQGVTQRPSDQNQEDSDYAQYHSPPPSPPGPDPAGLLFAVGIAVGSAV